LEEEEEEGLLFLKKKKQKDFYSGVSGKIRALASILGAAERYWPFSLGNSDISRE
jgi:exopolyphosphatase/pppGpp-phosphohydrolase